MGLTETHIKQLQALTAYMQVKNKEVINAIQYLDEVALAVNNFYSRANAVEMLAKAQHAYIIALADQQTMLNRLNEIHVSHLQSLIESVLRQAERNKT